MNFNRTKRRGMEKRLLVIAAAMLIFVATASPFVFVPGLVGVQSNSAQAFNFRQSLDGIAKNTGFSIDEDQSDRLPEIIGLIIYGALGMTGVLFLILAIMAGFRWMTASGNEEQVKQARQSLINASIGVMVILTAYAVTYFILTLVLPEPVV